MGFETHLAVFFFNLIMVLFTLPAFMFAKVCIWSSAIVPLEPGCLREKAVLIFTCIMWRMTMFCACWVRQDIDGLASFRENLGASGRPCILVANHASFLDTILLVTYMPLAKQAKIKMLVSSHLFHMPVIGTIAKAMGHKAVPFKATGADGSFELDKEVMAKRQQEMELHVASGGLAGWFPEGTMNRGDVREISTFRAGGFAIPVHVDVEIWCIAFQGNTVCWPRAAPVGGRPSKIQVQIRRLCESSHASIATAGLEGDERAASIHLANSAHDVVQAAVRQMCP